MCHLGHTPPGADQRRRIGANPVRPIVNRVISHRRGHMRHLPARMWNGEAHGNRSARTLRGTDLTLGARTDTAEIARYLKVFGAEGRVEQRGPV